MILFLCSGIKSHGQEIDTISIELLYEKYQNTYKSNYDASRQTFDKLLNELHKARSARWPDAVIIYNLLAYSEIDRNPQLADSLLAIAFEDAYQFNDKALPSIYMHYGIYNYRMADFDKALNNYQTAFETATAKKDTDIMVISQFNLGSLLLLEKGDTSGLKHMKETRTYALKEEIYQWYADASLNLAIYYHNIDNYSTALTYNTEALQVLDTIHDPENYLSALNNQAVLYEDMGIDSLAITYYNRTLAQSKVERNDMLRAIALINLGSIYHEHEKDSMARASLTEALSLSKKSGSDVNLGSIYLNLGNIDSIPANKLSYYHKSLAISRKLKQPGEIASALNYLAEWHDEYGSKDSTFHYASEAYKLAEPLENLVEKSESKLYMARGLSKRNPQKAIQYFEDYISLNEQVQDSIDSEKNATFAARYELQKRDSENEILKLKALEDAHLLEVTQTKLKTQKIIIFLTLAILLAIIGLVISMTKRTRERKRLNHLLTIKNQEMNKLNSELQKENNFKNKLLSVVSHDIRSPVVSLYHMTSLAVYEEPDPKIQQKAMVEILKNTEKTIGLIDNLLLWTREQIIHNSTVFEAVNLQPILDETLDLYQHLIVNNKLTITNSLPPGSTVLADVNMLKIIFRNIISNAIKFTPSRGTIAFSGVQNRSKFTFTIEDSGEGINTEKLNSILTEEFFHTTHGLNNEQGHGLGLKLTKYFIDKINGKIWAESEENKGTTFFIELPVGPNTL